MAICSTQLSVLYYLQTKRPVAMNDLIEEICSWIDPDLHHLVRTTPDFRKVNDGRPRA